jgi:predicted neutral ceramidase superfamily lipid hydrolase
MVHHAPAATETDLIMRAELEAMADAVKQSVGLLRRHL